MTKDDGPTTARRSADAEHNDALHEVFERVRQGSEEAFAEFYDMTSARVHGLILSVIRAPDLKGSVRAWMNTIAHRRAVDRVRSVHKETERDVRWAGTSRENEPDHTWEGVEQRLDVAGVRSALEELSTVQKEAVSLAYYGGYSHREVAEMLGLPLGTVKTRIRDGLLGLRSVMGARA